MASSIADQLSALPLLTTVLRVDFDLIDSSISLAASSDLLKYWASSKAKAFDLGISWSEDYDNLRSSGVSVEYARTEDSFSLSLSHRDAHQSRRDWITEVALSRKDKSSTTRFSTRLSIRQSRDSYTPLPRAPKYIGELVRTVGAVDYEVLEPEGRRVGSDNFEYLDRLLTSPRRTLPILAISEDQVSLSTSVDPEEFARYIVGIAHVVVLTPQAAWMLTDKYGQERSTFNGAVRCYMPGFTAVDGPYKHKLWLREGIRRTNAVNSNGFLNACLRFIFAATTAQFEPYPLLTPSSLRRQAQEALSLPTLAAPLPSDAEVAADEPPSVTLVDAARTVPPPTHESEGITFLEDQLKVLEATYTRRLNEVQEEAGRLELLLQEARDETAQKNRELTNLQPLRQEVEDLRDELSILKGEYEVKDAPVLKDFWDGFNLFFGAAKDLVSQFERMQRQAREDERIKEERDGYIETIAELESKMFHKDRKIESLSEIGTQLNFPLFPNSWTGLLTVETQRLEWLLLSKSVLEELLHTSFDLSLAKEINDLLEILNSIGLETRADGSLSEAGKVIYQEYFSKANAWFSDEIPTSGSSRLS